MFLEDIVYLILIRFVWVLLLQKVEPCYIFSGKGKTVNIRVICFLKRKIRTTKHINPWVIFQE